MLSRVTAKNVGDVFWDTVYRCKYMTSASACYFPVAMSWPVSSCLVVLMLFYCDSPKKWDTVRGLQPPWKVEAATPSGSNPRLNPFPTSFPSTPFNAKSKQMLTESQEALCTTSNIVLMNPGTSASDSWLMLDYVRLINFLLIINKFAKIDTPVYILGTWNEYNYNESIALLCIAAVIFTGLLDKRWAIWPLSFDGCATPHCIDTKKLSYRGESAHLTSLYRTVQKTLCCRLKACASIIVGFKTFRIP